MCGKWQRFGIHRLEVKRTHLDRIIPIDFLTKYKENLMTSNSYRGVFTIPSTPFRENGEIDIPSFRRMIDFCIECGSHGLVYPVNASEFTALSDAERLELSEVLVKQNAGQLPAIIGVAGWRRRSRKGSPNTPAILAQMVSSLCHRISSYL